MLWQDYICSCGIAKCFLEINFLPLPVSYQKLPKWPNLLKVMVIYWKMKKSKDFCREVIQWIITNIFATGYDNWNPSQTCWTQHFKDWCSRSEILMEKIEHCILVPDICKLEVSTKIWVMNFLMPLITEKKKVIWVFQSLKGYLIKTQGSNEDLFHFFKQI